MRDTTLNKPIPRSDIKVGDKIRISREVEVKKVRHTSIYGGLRNQSKPVTIVDTDGDTVAISDTEGVTLLERDRESVKIPDSAQFVYWQDRDGEDYYARYDTDREVWIEDDMDEYTTEKLIPYIEHYLKEGTFQVLKHKYASGGVVGGLSGGGYTSGANPLLPGVRLSQEAMANLRDQMSRSVARNILPNSAARR